MKGKARLQHWGLRVKGEVQICKPGIIPRGLRVGEMKKKGKVKMISRETKKEEEEREIAIRVHNVGGSGGEV